MEEKKSGAVSLRLVSFLIGLAAVASALAYLLYRMYENRLHEEKWRDYEDCGI